MSAVQPRDILAYFGGRSLTQYGTATRRTQRLARAGEAQAETLTRADASICAPYRGSDGLYHLAGPNILRPMWFDLNADGVFETPTLLMEALGVTNRLLQARNLGTTWTASNFTATINAQLAGVDGVAASASKLTPNNSVNTNQHNCTQAVTITSGEWIAGSVFLQAAGYSGAVFRIGDAGSTNSFQAVVDLSAGTILASSAAGAATLTGSAIVPWGGGWYQVMIWGAINASVTTAQAFVYCYDTGAHAQSQTAFTGDGVSGIGVDIVHLQRDGTGNTNIPPSLPLITLGSTVTRSGDLFSLPFWAPPSNSVTVYLKFIEIGSAALGVGQPRMVAIGNSGSTGPIAYLTYNTGYSARWNDSIHTLQASTISSLIPTYGQVVELLLTLGPGGVVQLTESINGAAPTVGTPSGGSGLLTSSFLAPVLYANSANNAAVERCIVVDGVHSMPELQAVA